MFCSSLVLCLNWQVLAVIVPFCSILCCWFQFTVAECDHIQQLHPRFSSSFSSFSFPSRTVLSNEFFLSIWSIQFLRLSRIVSISVRCSPTIMGTCSFVMWSDQLMFSIFLQIHISHASSLLTSLFLKVRVSNAYRTTLQTETFTIRFLSSFDRVPLSSSPLLLNASFAIAIRFWISFKRHPSSVIVLQKYQNSVTCSISMFRTWIVNGIWLFLEITTVFEIFFIFIRISNSSDVVCLMLNLHK